MTKRTLQVLSLFALFVLTVGCQSAKLPNELLGIWRTDAPAYKGRYMKCDPQFVVLGVGEEKPVPRKVVGITKMAEGVETLYTLKTNEKEEGEYSFSFYYSAADGGTIRFKNQPQLIWKKGELEVE
jgi:hypothetical protein